MFAAEREDSLWLNCGSGSRALFRDWVAMQAHFVTSHVAPVTTSISKPEAAWDEHGTEEKVMMA
jgi:hypothetical protein